MFIQVTQVLLSRILFPGYVTFMVFQKMFLSLLFIVYVKRAPNKLLSKPSYDIHIHGLWMMIVYVHENEHFMEHLVQNYKL